MPTLILHMQNEDPILGEVDELPVYGRAVPWTLAAHATALQGAQV